MQTSPCDLSATSFFDVFVDTFFLVKLKNNACFLVKLKTSACFLVKLKTNNAYFLVKQNKKIEMKYRMPYVII